MGSYTKRTVSEALKSVFLVNRTFQPAAFETAVDMLAEMICDNASSGEGYSYLANVSQTGTAAPYVITQITNTFPSSPTYTYKSTGNYRITFSNNCWLNNYGYFNSGVCVSAGSSAVIGTFAMAAESASSVLLFTYNNSSVSANNILNNTQIKISQARITDISNFLEVKDSYGNYNTLTFGRALYASDGLDSNLGEYELPPYPPSGAYDARMMPASGYEYAHLGSLKDYRDIQTSSPTSVYKFRFQFGSTYPNGANGLKSNDPTFPNSTVGVNLRFTLSPLVQSVRIQDVITGTFFDTTLTASGTANLSGNVLGFNQYKLTVTYF